MICPSCGHEKDAVIDSRCSKGITRRRRQCKQCFFRHTTYELTSEALEKMNKMGGVSEAIETVFGVLDLLQDMTRQKLNNVLKDLPSSYLKLKRVKQSP